MLQENFNNAPIRQAVRIRTVASKTGLGVSTVRALVKSGKFPRPFRLVQGGRASGWWLDEIDAYLEARSRDTAA